MKKISALFLSLFLSTALITSCSTTTPSNPDGGSNNSDVSNTSVEPGDNTLPYSLEEVKNKLLNLGQTSGFEITLKGEASSTDGTASVDEVTIGLVRDLLWVKETGAYKQAGTSIEVYDYIDGKYVYQATTDVMDFAGTVSTMTNMLYYAYEYVKNAEVTLVKTGDITFLNRRAYQYEASITAMGNVAASFNVIIDAETGITLKFAAKGTANGETGEGVIEVTAFKVGNDVRTPELVKDDDPGSSTTSTEEHDIPGKGNYPLDESQSQNFSDYKGSAIIINDGGNGLFVEKATNTGEKYYFTGSFVLDSNNLVMTTVKYILESNGEIKTSTPTDGRVLTFTFIGNNSYGITFGDAYLVYKLDESPIVDPETERFIVTQTQYTSIINNMDYLDYDKSATFSFRKYRGADLENTVTFKADEGVYHESLTNNYYMTTSEYFYEAVNGQPGYYNFYSYSNNEWTKTEAIQYESSIEDHSHFGDLAGIRYLSYIPFSEFSAPSGTNTYYRCNSYKTNNNDTLTDVSVMFVDGALYKASYVVNNLFKYDLDVSNINNTSVTLPDIAEQEVPEDCASLLYENEGTTYVYDKIVNNGFDQDQVSELELSFTNQEFYFFTDKTAELFNKGNGIELVYLGEFNAMKKPSDVEADVEVKLHEVYVNDKKSEDYTEEHINFKFDVEKKELHLGFAGYNTKGEIISLDVIFKNANKVPTHYEGGTQTSLWDETKVQSALVLAGFSGEKLPGAKYAANLAKEIEIKQSEKRVEIVATYKDLNSLNSEFFAFLGSLESEEYGYTMDIDSSDFDNYVYAYLSSSGKMLASVTYSEDDNSLIIVASEKVIPPYPTEEIEAYLTEQGLTNERVPELKVSSGSYKFTQTGVLIITLGATLSYEDAMEELEDILVKAGFLKYVYPYFEDEMDVEYVARSNRLSFSFSCDEEHTTIYVRFDVYSEDDLFDGTTTYPQSEIDKVYPEGTRDYVPDFSYRGVAYQYEANDREFTLYITPQAGQDSEDILRSITTALYEAEYGPNDDNIFVSPRGDIEISIGALYGGQLIVINIAFMYEVVDCVYTIYPIGNFTDWSDGGAQVYAYVWNYKGEGKWIPLVHDEDTDTYILECNSTWIGCRIVRFANESDIAWPAGADGSVNPNVHIWDISADTPLSGQETDTISVELYQYC